MWVIESKKAAIMAGFKMKTRKAAAKRFWKATANGQVKRAKGGHGHFLSRRGQKARLSAGTTLVHESNYNQVNALVPALGARRKRSLAIKKALRRALAAAAALKATMVGTAKAPAAKAKPAAKAAE